MCKIGYPNLIAKCSEISDYTEWSDVHNSMYNNNHKCSDIKKKIKISQFKGHVKTVHCNNLIAASTILFGFVP